MKKINKYPIQYIFLFLALAFTGMLNAQEERDTVTIFENRVLEYEEIYSSPYSPQIPEQPDHGTVYWDGSTNTLGLVGNNILYYQPDSSFIGIDSLQLGYWKSSNFGPVYTNLKLIINVVPLSNSIKGSIVFDRNSNCELEASEEGLKNWMIKVSNEEQTYYTTTNESGVYNMSLEDGNYIIEAISPNPTWEFCEQSVEVNLDGNVIEIINFAAQAVDLMPFLEVDISTGSLVACEDNFYQINYCNKGTSTVEGAYVEITLDPFLVFHSADTDFTNWLGNLYTFPLGDLAPDSCGTFRIYFSVDCEVPSGQTHCTEAQIFPLQYFDWDGPILDVDSRCEGDSVYFRIKNVSETDMPETSEFIVIEDQVVYLQGDFMLNGGDSLIVKKAANGRMFRLETFQMPDFPYRSYPSASVEGCSNHPENEVSRGVLSQYPEDDLEPFISVDCRESNPISVPHSLIVFPRGYDDLHLISPSMDLEYVLLFENTGTDTITQVVLQDVISPYLDMTTVRFGASSHPYQVTFSGSDTLIFTFKNMLLLPQNMHGMASRGFLKFKISQKTNNPLNIEISNHAAVSFDDQAPVSLVPVFHTVQENFIRTTKPLPVTPKRVTTPSTFSGSVKAYPNPVIDRLYLDIVSPQEAAKTVELFDLWGQRLAIYEVLDTPFMMSTGQLKKGVYFYLIKIEEEEVWGKLLIP